MATPQQPQQQFVVKPTVVVTSPATQQQNIALVREKLKELGPGPYTPEQQKLRDAYTTYLNKENANANTQLTVVQQLIPQQPQQQQQQPPPPPPQQQQQQQQQQQDNTIQQSAAAAATQQASSQQNLMIDKRTLQDLVKEVDPTEQLDEDVEDMLLQIADDFIENVINSSCQLAKHRKSNILEPKDVQFHLERNYNIWIPGFSTDELKPYKKSLATEAHKQRLQLIKKSTSKPGDAKDKASNN